VVKQVQFTAVAAELAAAQTGQQQIQFAYVVVVLAAQTRQNVSAA
jgi:hypothetical protein